MNPKEQAERIVKRYEALEWNDLYPIETGMQEFENCMNRFAAKQCAEIALEDKITILKKIRKEIGLDISWIESEEEVLKAIKEL